MEAASSSRSEREWRRRPGTDRLRDKDVIFGYSAVPVVIAPGCSVKFVGSDDWNPLQRSDPFSSTLVGSVLTVVAWRQRHRCG